MKRIMCMFLVFSMMLLCVKDCVCETKERKTNSQLLNYIVSAKSERRFQQVKEKLEKEGKIVNRHKVSDDKLLNCNQSLTAEMTAVEAKELEKEDLLVEKDESVTACENDKLLVPHQSFLNPFVSEKNEFAEGEENIECTSVKTDLPKTNGKEYTENPEKFKPCKNIKNKKNEVVPWNIKCVAGVPHDNKYKGKGVKVAVIDSGIDTHDELNTKGWVDFSDRVKGYKPIDNSGHGTQTAGVIAARINGIGMEGIASKAEIYSVKILDAENKATISAVVKAVEWCIQNDIDIINMSFGTSVYSNILHEEIKKAESQGIVMVAAAGNNENKIQYPAQYPEVISVGSIDDELKSSQFSNNEKVDLVAPGENVQTLGYMGSFSMTEGTSIATAHVTGVAASVMSANRNLSNTEIRNVLIESAISLSDGTRLVNYKNAIDRIKSEKKLKYQKEAEVKNIVQKTVSDEESFVEGSWNSETWQGIDGTGHFTIINKIPLSYFGNNNESETEKTYHRWIAARASYLTDKLEWLSGSHVLGKANRNDAGEIVMDGQEFKPPYHASSKYSINEVVSSHLQFLYELARRRIVLGSNLDLVATNYSGDTYYKVSIPRKMKRRIIVDLRAVHEHLSVYFQNYPINMNTATNRGYMVLGVFLHLVADIQAHRAQIKHDMLFAQSDGMVYYGYDSFTASAAESRINGSNIKGTPNNFDTYWELHNLLKQGPLPMIRLQSRLKDSFTIGYNGKQYNCTKASAYEDNPYFYSDRFDTACWYSWAYIDRMRGDTGHYSTQTGYYYADGRVPLC